MLQSRISQIKTYLSQLPPSYLTDASIPISSSTDDNSTSHQILRSILALTSRLPHLLPADIDTFLQEQSAERADAAIVSLLGTLGRSVLDAKDLGRTYVIAECGKNMGRAKVRGHTGLPDQLSMISTDYGIGRTGGEADWQNIDEA